MTYAAVAPPVNFSANYPVRGLVGYRSSPIANPVLGRGSRSLFADRVCFLELPILGYLK